MMKRKLCDVFEKPLSGEWGVELEEGEKGVYVIRTTNFTNLGVLNLKDVVSRKIDIDKYQSKLLKMGDIIIEKSGGSPTQPVGRVVIFEENNEEKYFCNNFTSILRPKSIINPKYSLYMMKDLYKRKKVLKYQNKTTGIINLKLNDYLNNTEVSIPDIDKQIRIATILDKSQKLIDKRKAQIEALDELVKSRFIDMFGDPVKNQKKLTKVELGKVGEWKTGGTPSRSNNEYYNGNISWLSSGELNNMYCFNSIEMITELAIKESSAKIIEKGSLLLGMYDTAALKSTINMIECSCNQAIAYSKLDEKLVNTIYVYYCIQIGKDFYKSQQRGVRQKNLNLSMIKGLEILMPDLNSQNQFADFVNQIDKLKFEMQKSLEEMENNFNSLMQRAFKGELFN
ncbi:restriction endonuclease subunit S [Clostridium saccharobutylicum]|uniref:EcoKI restriction-modification system protein HsdS n=1 Tax=Clostridium saccharobutylicum TaxID=169679 RepID=A0A1S8NE40_CLOSA|nr:restriction endonuclease subunit S [Clostridium saccharobutylicum]OOM14652.1 EcoKI restriction-modification system protein HsdS [Clostridium saccharobutylicum]